MRSGESAPCAAPGGRLVQRRDRRNELPHDAERGVDVETDPVTLGNREHVREARAPRLIRDDCERRPALEPIDSPHACKAGMPELRELRDALAQGRFEASGQERRRKAQLLQTLAGAFVDDQARAERIGARRRNCEGHDGSGLHGLLGRSCTRRAVPAHRGGASASRATAVPTVRGVTWAQ